MQPTLGLISLGCAKNRVDTEGFAGLLQEVGFSLVADPAQAEYIIINTCCFIRSAQEESVDTILAAARYKTEGRCKVLAVVGCLVQRFGEKLQKLLPEVDLWLGTADYHRLPELLLAKEPPKGQLVQSQGKGWFLPEGRTRLISTPAHWAYLKIGEGCDNCCTYCVIPSVRGRRRSRSMQGIVAEAEQLLQRGVKELNLIAQDTSAYGLDRSDGASLARLLRELDGFAGEYWLRILYAYPSHVDQQLLETIAASKHVTPYIDLPMQHAHPRILDAMGRKGMGERLPELVREIREVLPQAVIRSTFITGFPGETEEEFQALLDFVQDAQLDWVGVFPYSREEGTPAASFKGQVHPATRKRRARQLMEVQAGITAAKQQELVGAVVTVLVEENDGSAGWGRSYREAPEVDGKIYFIGPAKVGEFYKARIVGILPPYDLKAELISAISERSLQSPVEWFTR
ncbi:MAG TPA: 30S ribosomal protein S12 methylthiotransferase RimO [Firmicutes bacterium]|nr:30S ribosomal protein S12 methylthiotransferase RimO [Bacillota bacterium]